MALLDPSRPVSQSAVFADAVSRAAYRVVSGLIEWNNARQTRNSLMQLTAQELDDIGLSRADVDMMIKRIRF